MRREADGGIQTSELEIVFQRDGQTMERSYGLARLGEMLIASARGGNGTLKASLRKTVYLLMMLVPANLK